MGFWKLLIRLLVAFQKTCTMVFSDYSHKSCNHSWKILYQILLSEKIKTKTAWHHWYWLIVQRSRQNAEFTSWPEDAALFGNILLPTPNAWWIASYLTVKDWRWQRFAEILPRERKRIMNQVKTRIFIHCRYRFSSTWNDIEACQQLPMMQDLVLLVHRVLVVPDEMAFTRYSYNFISQVMTDIRELE